MLTVLVGFIGLRLILVLSNIDTVHELDIGELKHFAFTKEVRGLELFESRTPWLDRRGPHGAYTLNIILYWILARVLGEGYVPLKCVAIAYAAATLWIWMAILRRFFGLGAALIFAALFSFPSASLMAWTSTVWGSHPETCFFSALCVYLFFRYYYFKQPPRRLAAFGLFGAFLGLCEYISLLFIPALLLCSIFILWRYGKKSIARISVLLMASMMVMFPLHYVTMKLGEEKPIEFYEHDLTLQVLASEDAEGKATPVTAAIGLVKHSLEKLGRALSTDLDLPVAPMLEVKGVSSGRLDLQRLNLAATLFLFFVGAVTLRRMHPVNGWIPHSRDVACFIYAFSILFYLFVAIANPFPPALPYRYLIVGLPFIFSGMSLAVYRMAPEGSGPCARWLQGLLVSLLLVSLLCGLRDTIPLISMRSMARAKDFRVIDYIKLDIGRVHMPYLDGVNRFVDFINAHRDEDLLAGFRIVFPLLATYDCILNTASCVCHIPGQDRIHIELRELEARGRRREALHQGIGWAVGLRRGGDREACGAIFREIAPHDQSALWQGFERGIPTAPESMD